MAKPSLRTLRLCVKTINLKDRNIPLSNSNSKLQLPPPPTPIPWEMVQYSPLAWAIGVPMEKGKA